MQLVEQGKLDLYADVNQYLGEFQLDNNWNFLGFRFG
jgi:CubicO group peptidase (beta-lactamase class C family)